MGFEILWIVFGILYLVYRYCREDRHKSVGESLGCIGSGLATFAGVAVAGLLAYEVFNAILNASWEIGAILGGLVIVGLLALLGWLILGDVKEKNRNALLPDEVYLSRLDLPCQSLPGFPDPMDKAKMEAFRRRRFDVYDEYLTAEEALEYANRVQEERDKLSPKGFTPPDDSAS